MFKWTIGKQSTIGFIAGVMLSVIIGRIGSASAAGTPVYGGHKP